MMAVNLPIEIRIEVEKLLDANLHAFVAASGGCVNHGGKVDSDRGRFFIKWNNRHQFPGMFKAENEGLKLLARAQVIRVPHVVLAGQTEKFQFLILEWIASNPGRANFWEQLGRDLAALHRHQSKQHGLPFDNYIGSLQQRNRQSGSWSDFFIQQRIRPQLDLLALESRVISDFDRLFEKMPGLIPEEQPSLLHGDLWRGNVMMDDMGAPCVIDPAVFFGHREAELAFTRLFGGFEDDFYESYDECFPLEKGHRDRVDLFNLYPLLVHANLFGGGYLDQALRIVSRYV